MAIERLPPQNVEAEQAVLGSLLINQGAVALVASGLRPSDFYRQTHGLIYQAILDLHERREPADFVTLGDELERGERLEQVGGRAYLASLLNAVPTAVHVEHYAHVVERTARLRRLIEAAGQIAALAYQEAEDVDEVMDRAESLIFQVTGRSGEQGLTPVKTLLGEYFDHLEELQGRGAMMGLPSGFSSLDKLTGGFQKSDLIVVAGRPGMGKSSLCWTVAGFVGQTKNVAVFSLEMSGQQVVQRLLAAASGIDSQRLRLGRIREEEWTAFVQASGPLSETGIFVDDTPGLSPLEMRRKCRRLDAERGLDMIVVDYLQLMRANQRTYNREQEVSFIARSLKMLARELDVPLLAVSQLSRAVEGRQDKRPVLSDLRESGAIEQEADVVAFIYRDQVYNENTDTPNIADVIVAKHRHGPTGVVPLYFKKELAQFREVTFEAQELDFVEEVADDHKA